MNIQIFGKSKCFDTKKAERYFKERGIKFQKIDLLDKGLSKGELNSVAAALGLNALFDMESPLYKELNLDRIGGHELRAEILLNHPKLFKTPIVRNGKQATLGYCPEIWKTWL